MTATWLPLAAGILPLSEQSGPLQAEEWFASRQRALENARSEYQARHYDVATAVLAELIPVLRTLADDAEHALLLASSLVLQARLHWRRAERERDQGNIAAADQAEATQTEVFLEALDLFERHQAAIPSHPGQSRLLTDFAIALHRTGKSEKAVEVLLGALATGIPPVEAFAYLGMAHCELEHYPEAVAALRKGLQLAPRDRVLLETLAITQELDGQLDAAVRTYCQAAIEAASNDDLGSTKRFLEAALAARPTDAQALSMFTLMLRAQGKADEARRRLDATLAMFPGHSWALGLRGMLSADAGDSQAALQDFGAVRVESADLVWVLLEQAKTLARTDFLAADHLLARARKWLPPTDARLVQAQAEVAVRAALALAGRGAGTAAVPAGPQLVRGIELLRLAAETLPDRVEPREALAWLQLQSNHLEEAAAALDEATRLQPESASLMQLRAKLSEAQGDPTAALRYYRRAVRLAPRDDAALENLLQALDEAGLADEVLRELDRRLAETPDHAPALVRKGRLLVQSGQFAESLAPLKRAETLLANGTSLEARILLGRALSSLDRHDEARAAFERAVPIDNAIGDARAYLGLLLINTAEYDRAAELLRQTIDDVKGWRNRLAWLHSSRGWALYCAGTTPFADLEAIFRTSLDLLPDAPFARKNLGQVLLRLPDRVEEGKEILDRLTELSAGQAPPDLVGWCHFRLGRLEAAEHWLRAAVRDNPDDATIRFDLALLLLTRDGVGTDDAYAAALARTERSDPPRQRGLLHVAALDVRESIADGVIGRDAGLERQADLLGRLRALGVSEARLRPLQAQADVVAS